MKALLDFMRAPSVFLRPGLRGLLFGLMVLESGCDGTPNDVVASKSPAAVSVPGRVTLSAEESSRVGLLVQPVARSDFRTHRDFPAIVQPNQRNMAEITTLVRGRVVEVYADLGQDVKANASLAILYSSELGLAQSAYLKAKAKLHVAEQAYSTGSISSAGAGHRRSRSSTSTGGAVEYSGGGQ